MNILADLKTWRFWRHFLIQSFACAGYISAAIQLILIIWPNQIMFFQGGILLLIIVILCLFFGLTISWPRPIEMEYSQPKTRIKIIKGDLLKQEGHIVVGICSTFDTETPNIISQKSLLGQTLNKLFGNDIKELDRLLAEALVKEMPIGNISKLGKTKKYELGTVAMVSNNLRHIFFLAYCEMNEKNEASASFDSIWKSLFSLWESQSAYGNHGSISIPVIGGGLARISSWLPAQDSIRLIALSFMFASRIKKISDELIIVVQPSDYDRLDRLELQSFLASLRPS